jgi:hypothetical protein
MYSTRIAKALGDLDRRAELSAFVLVPYRRIGANTTTGYAPTEKPAEAGP